MKPAERKLRDIMPYLSAAHYLSRFGLYRLYDVYAFGQLVIAGLATVGFVDPLIVALKSIGGETQPGKTGSPVPSTFLSSSALGGIAGLAILILWLLLWAYLTKADGQKRALLAKSCVNSLKSQSHRLRKAVQESDPIPGLNKVAEDIHQIVDRAIVENAWPWEAPDLFPKSPEFKQRWQSEVASIVEEHGTKWSAADDGIERMPKSPVTVEKPSGSVAP